MISHPDHTWTMYKLLVFSLMWPHPLAWSSHTRLAGVVIHLLEHSYSDSSNLIGQLEVPYFHSDTVEGTTCSALALRAWLFYM